MKTIFRNITLCLFLVSPFFLNAQGTGCNNFDFSRGFSNWKGRTGEYSSGAGDTVPIFKWTEVEIPSNDLSNVRGNYNCHYDDIEEGDRSFYTFNRATIGELMDAYAPSLPKIPDGSDYSARIGNSCGWHQCDGLTYEYSPILGKSDLLILKYAMVLMSPHPGEGTANPTFDIKVTVKEKTPGQNYDKYISRPDLGCASLTIAADSKNTGTLLKKSPIKVDGYDIVYRDWATIGMDLRNFVGEDVRVEISSSDCKYQEHFGYAYFTGTCTGMKIATTGCPLEEGIVTYAQAPEGFRYEWYYADASGSNPDLSKDLLGTEQSLPVRESYFGPGQQDLRLICITSSLTGPCKPSVPVDITNFKPVLSFSDTVNCLQEITFKSTARPAQPSGYFPRILNDKSYFWDFGDGEVVTGPGVQNHTHKYINPGTYEVSLSTTAQYISVPRPGSPIDTITCGSILIKQIYVPETPNPSISPLEVCQGEPVDIRAMGGNPAFAAEQPYTYQWVGEPAGSTVTGSTLSATFNADTPIKVIATHDSTGCKDSVTRTIVAMEYPKIQITATPSPSICYGNSVNINATSSNGVSYTWTNDKDFLWWKDSPSLREKPLETTTYTVSVANRIGCTSSDYITISVMKPVISISSTDTCAGDVVVLSATGAEFYEWTAEPGDPSLTESNRYDATISVTPSQTTNYKLVGGSNISGCKTVPFDNVVKISPYPVPQFDVIPAYIDFANPTINLRDKSTYGASREWIFEDGAYYTTANVNHKFNAQDLTKDSTLVILKSYNALGCLTTLERNIPVEMFTLWAPNAFTPKKSPNEIFKLYSKNDFSEFDLRIYDRWGQEVFAAKDVNTAWDGTKGGKDLPVGAYSWRVNYKFTISDRLYQKSGVVNLIR